MRKTAPAAFFISGFMVFGALFVASPAHADDDDEEGTSEVTQSPAPLRPIHKEGDEKRKQLREKYGKQGKLSLPPLVIRPKRDTDDLEGEEGDEEDEDEVENEQPAIVSQDSNTDAAVAADSKVTGAGVKVAATQPTSQNTQNLGVASTNFIAINPMTAAEGLAGGTGRAVNPHQNIPIDISTVRLTRKTPAEVFIQASQVGLFAMAAGALVLGVIAASRAIRRK